MDRGAQNIFSTLVFGAICLIVVSIVLMIGMDIAAEFASSISSEPVEPSAPIQIWPPLIIWVVLMGGVIAFSTTAMQPQTSTSEPRSELDRLQDDYVEGDLSLDEFEERAYEEIKVEI